MREMKYLLPNTEKRSTTLYVQKLKLGEHYLSVNSEKYFRLLGQVDKPKMYDFFEWTQVHTFLPLNTLDSCCPMDMDYNKVDMDALTEAEQYFCVSHKVISAYYSETFDHRFWWEIPELKHLDENSSRFL